MAADRGSRFDGWPLLGSLGKHFKDLIGLVISLDTLFELHFFHNHHDLLIRDIHHFKGMGFVAFANFDSSWLLMAT